MLQFFTRCFCVNGTSETYLKLFFFFFSGVIGSGVCVFSRYPIIDAFTYRYSLNGYMYTSLMVTGLVEKLLDTA